MIFGTLFSAKFILNKKFLNLNTPCYIQVESLKKNETKQNSVLLICVLDNQQIFSIIDQ